MRAANTVSRDTIRYQQMKFTEILPLDRPDLILYRGDSDTYKQSLTVQRQRQVADLAGTGLSQNFWAPCYDKPVASKQLWTISFSGETDSTYDCEMLWQMISHLPVYGKGENIRDWLYVEDHCRAIDLIIRQRQSRERFTMSAVTTR